MVPVLTLPPPPRSIHGDPALDLRILIPSVNHITDACNMAFAFHFCGMRTFGRDRVPLQTLSTLPPSYDKHLYQVRHLVENAFLKLKKWRGIAPVIPSIRNYIGNARKNEPAFANDACGWLSVSGCSAAATGTPNKNRLRELSTEFARALVDECRADPNTTLGLRDCAMMLIGFAGAFRRSELVRISVADLEWKTQGVEITLPWSKTDQEGKGQVKYITRGQVPVTDPVETLKRWLEISGIKEGPVFRRVFKDGSIGKTGLSVKAVLHTIKGRAQALGLDDWDDFPPHSLRSGFASVAAENGASIQSIKGQGGWKSDRTAMRYIRRRDSWEGTAVSKLGLQVALAVFSFAE